ncbi:MAG: radical SAM protein [Candidatus Omnitrophota bacterium]
MTYLDKKTIRLSEDVHLFERDGFAAFFHSLRMTKIYGDGKTLATLFRYLKTPRRRADAVKRFSKPLIEKLMSEGMAVEGMAAREASLKRIKKLVGKFDITNIVLLVSNNCNFRCSYCQIEENMAPEHMVNMSREVAGKALDLFRRNSRPGAKKTITITGGEPLLNMDVVRFIIDKVRRELKNTRIVIFTNGSLVTKELAVYFKDNDILMLISLDGPREMHDSARKMKAGGGSFGPAMNGYKLLKEAGCTIGISAVGGTHNVKEIRKTFKFFTDLAPSSIGFNFSHFLLNKDNPTEIPIVDFGRILVEFYGILRERRIFLENVSRPIGAFASNKPKVNECQAQGHGFTVDARGKIGPCKSLVVSDIFSEDMARVPRIDKNPMFMDWATRSPFMVSKCADCTALSICGGGCAYDSYISNKGDFKGIDERVCEYKRYILDYLIWDLFGKIKSKVIKNKFYSPSVKEQESAFNGYYDRRNELQRSVGHENDK